jgi:succinate-semialdehyde dehydrogenase/glutarate-semialdehyde dehydrogenase
LKEAATAYVASKFNNAGQTCIAAKRLLLAREIEEPFLLLAAELIDQLVIGDPLSRSTDLGCMARPDLVDKLESQVQNSISMGAEVILQGGRSGQTNFFHPMLVGHVLPGMPLFEEEVFGPVGVICSFDSIKEAVELANLSKYGLGCSIWSEDLMKAKDIAGKINAGSIHINQMVVSDPRVPFGGVKRSGFGRELGLNGIKEFVNIKTVTVA